MQEDLAEEKKEGRRLEEIMDKANDTMGKADEELRNTKRQLAKMEIENDEMKNHVR